MGVCFFCLVIVTDELVIWHGAGLLISPIII